MLEAEKAGIIIDDVIISYNGIDNLNNSDSLIKAVKQALDKQEDIELIVLSALGVLSGLFFVMAAQATRAVMDNADYSKLILE